MTGLQRRSIIVLVAAGAAAIMLLNLASLPKLALLYGFAATSAGGLLALVWASIQTTGLIAAALITAMLLNSLMNFMILASEAAAVGVLRGGILLTAIPLFALIPLWLSVTGDGWAAGYGFLTFAILSYLVTTSAQSIQASSTVRRLIRTYRPGVRERLVVSLEFLWWSARPRLIATLAFTLPFSVGAELIAGRASGGLGVLATTAYRNGDFQQLMVVASAYALVSLILMGRSSATLTPAMNSRAGNRS